MRTLAREFLKDGSLLPSLRTDAPQDSARRGGRNKIQSVFSGDMRVGKHTLHTGRSDFSAGIEVRPV